MSKHDHDGHHDGDHGDSAHDEPSHHDDNGHHDASHAGHDASPTGYNASPTGYDVEHGGGHEAGHVDHAGHGGPVGGDLGGKHGSDAYGRGYARLEDADLTLRMGKDEEAKRLGKAQRRLLHLRLINGGQLNEGQLGPPVCIVFEGWDAAGKGGAIKRLVEPLDPRHVHIAPFAAPTPDELRHHFLWRFWPPLPGWGGMTIFDRSWYGRVLVERVEDLATEVQWRRAYQEINDFEHTLAEEGMIVIKLWMHLSHEEQLRRFVRRRDDPLKSWKLTPEDWRNREKRGAYEAAVSDMLRLTCGPLAHWDVIAGENKRYGRVQVIETVIRRMEQGMRRWGIDVPSHEAADEEFELALVIDDAEYQPDPAAVAAKAAADQAASASTSTGPGAGAGAGAGASAVAGGGGGGGGGGNSDRRRMEA